MFRTEELSKTRRVSFENKFEKLVHLVGFIMRKFMIVIMPVTVDIQTVHRTQWIGVLVFVYVRTKFHVLSHSVSLLNVRQGES